jgi:YVTN family beta-propeller protein
MLVYPPIQQYELQRAYASPNLKTSGLKHALNNTCPAKLLPKDFGDSVSVIDDSTKTIVATMPVGNFPANATFN